METFPTKTENTRISLKLRASALTMNFSKNISIKFIMDPLMPRYTAGLSPINVFVQFFRYSQIWFHWIQMSFFTSRQPGWWWKRKKKKVLPICVIRKLIIKCESWTLSLNWVDPALLHPRKFLTKHFCAICDKGNLFIGSYYNLIHASKRNVWFMIRPFVYFNVFTCFNT